MKQNNNSNIFVKEAFQDCPLFFREPERIIPNTQKKRQRQKNYTKQVLNFKQEAEFTRISSPRYILVQNPCSDYLEFHKIANYSSSRDALMPMNEETTEFSRKSRLRYLRFLKSLRYEKAIMVTLTISTDFKDEINHPVWREIFEAFCKRHKRKFRKQGFVWKLEFTRQEMPHVHFLLLDPKIEKIQDYREWLKDNWVDVLSKNVCMSVEQKENAWKACDEADWVKNKEATAAYLAFYLTFDNKKGKDKTYQNIVPEFYGSVRFWGYQNEKYLHYVQFLIKEISEDVFESIQNYMHSKKYIKYFNDSFIYFGKFIRSILAFVHESEDIQLEQSEIDNWSYRFACASLN